jgi:hypothetical protein
MVNIINGIQRQNSTRNLKVLDEMKAGNDEDNSMESKKIEMEQRKDIALVVHDNKKSVFIMRK